MHIHVSAALFAVLLAAMYSIPALAGPVKDLADGAKGDIDFTDPDVFFQGAPLTLKGELEFPDGAAAKVPAMIVLHGSGGRDRKSADLAEFLRKHGLATFRLDYFGPRGVNSSSPKQPAPIEDAKAALRILSTHPKIDRDRIGVVGQSRGGEMTLRLADGSNATIEDGRGSQISFAAFVALYPSCLFRSFPQKQTKSPILIGLGEKDELTPVSNCEQWKKAADLNSFETKLVIYPDTHHGWDSYGANFVHNHRAVGKSYRILYNAAATEKSRADILAFLRPALRLN